MHGTTFKLMSFIGLSIAVHGLLFLIKDQPGAISEPMLLGNQMLSVSLNVNNETATPISSDTNIDNDDISKSPQRVTQNPVASTDNESSNHIISVQQPNSVSATKIIASSDAEKLPTKQSAAKPDNTITKHQPFATSQGTVETTAQVNFLLGEIHHQLSQYMHYPTRARRRGWEGSVLIGFNVDRQGFLQNIHLSRTSGYSLLDNAALSAVKKVNHLPVSKWGHYFHPIALQLPVVYRLTNS